MRHRFALLALLAALVLALAACGADQPPDPGAAAPTTAGTAAAPEPTTAPPTSRAETARPAPDGVVAERDRRPAPDIRVTAFDGRTITLGGFRGRPVVVNFFESW